MGEPEEPVTSGEWIMENAPMTTPTAPLTAEHGRIPSPPQRSVGDWDCKCGWWGSHSWLGYAVHLESAIAAVRAEADVLRAAIPEDPWVRHFDGTNCYSCDTDQPGHDSDCKWLAARAAMQK